MTDWHLFKVKVVYQDNKGPWEIETHASTWRVAARDDVMARNEAIKAQVDIFQGIIVRYCEIKYLGEIDIAAHVSET